MAWFGNRMLITEIRVVAVINDDKIQRILPAVSIEVEGGCPPHPKRSSLGSGRPTVINILQVHIAAVMLNKREGSRS